MRAVRLGREILFKRNAVHLTLHIETGRNLRLSDFFTFPPREPAYAGRPAV